MQNTEERRIRHVVAAKKWRRTNRKKARAATEKWRLAHPKKHNARAKVYYQGHKEKVRARNLKNHFNLSAEEWELMFKFQNGLCAVCERPASDFTNRFAVDHDHSTRIVRGLLCYNCNTLLPNRKNLVALLQKLINYLNSPPAVAALGEERLANPLRRKKRKK